MYTNKSSAVVIATYNGARFIEEQLQSLVMQTRKPDFILVSDDVSKDKTVEICEKYLSDKNIEFDIKENKQSLGVTKNFIDLARSIKQDVIFFCDQDDVWDLNKIQVVMNVFENNEDCEEVITDSYIWAKGDKKFGVLSDRFSKLPIFDVQGKIDNNSFWRLEMEQNIAVGMCTAVTRTVINYDIEQSIYNIDKMLMYHDSYYTLIAGAIGNVYYVNEKLAYYRQHSGNAEGLMHHVNVAVLKRSVKRVKISFARFKERIEIIKKLDNYNHFLSDKNKDNFERYIKYNSDRSSYIKKHKPISMLILGLSNKQPFSFVMRDVFVSLIYK